MPRRWRNIAAIPAAPSAWNSAPAAAAVAYRWLELRATIVSEQDVPSDCLGLLSDITQRKEANSRQAERAPQTPAARSADRAGQPRGADGGTGRAGRTILAARCSRCWISTASRPFMPAWATPAPTSAAADGASAWPALGEAAQLFRVGGDSFALLFASAAPRAAGRSAMRWWKSAPQPYPAGRPRHLRALPASAWRRARESEDPLAPDQECRTGADRRQAAGRRLRPASIPPIWKHWRPAIAWRWKAICAMRLAHGQLDVFYQPIVRLADRSVAGFEALLRWHHPARA